ncbi:MAG: mechanosensitive ion channel [Acidimicrobiales bacterium]
MILADFTFDSTAGRWAITGAVVLGAVLVAWTVGRVVATTVDDPTQRYNARRLVRGAMWITVAVALVFVWKPLDGNLAPALGLATAGLAFAMQEVIGAIAGWFNITFGRVFRVGDRIEMDGVSGDVIDISLLKTRMMEIGSAGGGSWVQGRQFTGRVVSISNKATFTSPVFNYSSYFEYIWEELSVAVPHHGDWSTAVVILEEEANRLSDSAGAREAMREVRSRFPVPATEVEPRVFVSADEDYMRLAARFVVPTRSARSVIDEITRSVHTRLEDAGVEVVSTDVVQQAQETWEPVRARPEAHDEAGPG